MLKANKVICGDSLQEIKTIQDNTIHLILSDIPYGIAIEAWDVLHNNRNTALRGASPAQAKTTLFKSRGKPLNGWSAADKTIPSDYYIWCKSWAKDWLRVLTPGASCFIFAGRRLAHRCISALEDSGFIFKDMLSWQKQAAPHRAQHVSSVFKRRDDFNNAEKWDGWKLGNLRPLFEPILWFMKPYKCGETLTDTILYNNVGGYNEHFIKDNKLENIGLEIGSNIIKCKVEATDRGLHPTQKPVQLMEYLIGLTTVASQIVLDPFCGCGSTLLAAKNLSRRYIGIEKERYYYEIISKRLETSDALTMASDKK